MIGFGAAFGGALLQIDLGGLVVFREVSGE
jgi:hypothetical protein